MGDERVHTARGAVGAPVHLPGRPGHRHIQVPVGDRSPTLVRAAEQAERQ